MGRARVCEPREALPLKTLLWRKMALTDPGTPQGESPPRGNFFLPTRSYPPFDLGVLTARKRGVEGSIKDKGIAAFLAKLFLSLTFSSSFLSFLLQRGQSFLPDFLSGEGAMAASWAQKFYVQFAAIKVFKELFTLFQDISSSHPSHPS